MMLSPTSSPRAVRAITSTAGESPRGTPDLKRRAILGSTQADIEADKSRVIGELASRMKLHIPAFDKTKRGDDCGSCCSGCTTPTPQTQLLVHLSQNQTGCNNTSCNDEGDFKHAQLQGPSGVYQRTPHLRPLSACASAPSSPRLGRAAPLLVSSATLKLSNNLSPGSGQSTPRNRSKSPAADRISRPLAPTSSATLRISRPPNPSPSGGSPRNFSRGRSPTSSPKIQTGVTAIKTMSTRKVPTRPGINRSISADPNLKDPEVLAKIGNRMTKTVEKSIGTCGTCGRPVTVEGCTAFGKVYHKECFKCCVCKKRIDGKFFEKNGKPYCSKDFEKVVEECFVCKLPIKGDSVESNKKYYHPECMKCYVCGETLRGSYFTYKNQPICEKDYKQRAEKCCVCNVVIEGTYYTLHDETYCEEHYKEQCDKCPKCGEDVTGEHVRITGGVFHHDCFNCIVCGLNMANLSFITDPEMKIYCQDDYAKKKAFKCAYCKKPIVPKDNQNTAPRLRAMGKDFHPDCFKCEDCGLLLDSRVKGKECYPYKNHVLCLKCNRKKQSSSEEESDD